jgi:hypothetical protein
LLEQLHVRKLTAKLPIVFHTRSSKPLTHLWEDTQNIFKKTDVPLEKRSPTLFAGDFLHHPLPGRMGLPDVTHVMGHKDRHSSPLGHAENARRPDFALFQD